MSFTTYIPRFPLSEHIGFFWYNDEQLSYRREKILPTGTIDLIINFGSAYKQLDPFRLEEVQRQNRSWIVGLTKHHIVSESEGSDSHMIGVRFKPAGAYPFFDFPLSELADQIVEMDLIWGPFIHEVRERLLETLTLSGKFRVLEEVMLGRLSTGTDGLDVIQVAVTEISRPEAILTIKELSESIGISQKHLINQFKRMVGLPPKSLGRILRFNSVLNSIDSTRPPNWTEIAHQCHYFDQAHFNKDFTAFTGLNPTSYLDFRRQFLGQHLQQGEDVHFVPIG